MPVTASSLPTHALPPVVPAREWAAAHAALLVEEKRLTRARDALAAKRRRMPMTPVMADYRFAGPDGEVGLLDLFAGRRQLVVYRFFFQPDVDGWPDRGCGGCSFLTDHVPHLAHVNARDTTFALVSPDDQDRIAGLKERMGWEVPWYTLLDRGPGADFSADFDVAEMFGLNVFIHDDDGRVYRTYFVNGRGVEAFTPTWSILDITPLGRQEEWEDTPDGRPRSAMYWWGRHDEYS